MKAIKGFLVICFSCVLLGGLYIGSLILGYFLAAVAIVMSFIMIVVGLVIFVAYSFYETVKYYNKK